MEKNQSLTHIKKLYNVMYTKHIIGMSNGILPKMYINFNVEKKENNKTIINFKLLDTYSDFFGLQL